MFFSPSITHYLTAGGGRYLTHATELLTRVLHIISTAVKLPCWCSLSDFQGISQHFSSANYVNNCYKENCLIKLTGLESFFFFVLQSGYVDIVKYVKKYHWRGSISHNTKEYNTTSWGWAGPSSAYTGIRLHFDWNLVTPTWLTRNIFDILRLSNLTYLDIASCI